MTRLEELEQEIDNAVEKFRLEINKFKAEIEHIKSLVELEKLEELKESKKEGKWKPKEKEKYWYRDIDGEIYSDFWSNHRYDEFRYNYAPIFKTHEECEQYWHFMDTVKEKSYEFSKEEWEDDDVEKFSVGYIPVINDFAATYDDCKYLGKIYFKTEEDAQYIIDNFKEELMKYWL